jgi:molybdopterin-binding protein
MKISARNRLEGTSMYAPYFGLIFSAVYSNAGVDDLRHSAYAVANASDVTVVAVA